MNKNNIFHIAGKAMATMLLAATVLTGFTGCGGIEDNPVNPTPEPDGEVTEPYVEPTDDQLEVMVTADMPTAVLGQFDDNSVAAALVKRLSQTTNAIDDNTKLVLLNGSQVKSLTEADYFKLARIIMNGGYVALHRPTFADAFAYAMSVDDQFDDVQDAILKENGVEVVDDEEGEEAGANTRSREGGEMARKANNARALTRGAEDSDDENAVMEELVIFSADADYAIPPYSEEMTTYSQMEDEQGQEMEPVEHKEKILLNPYHCGHLADGVASWLNTKEQEKAEAQQPAAAGARTRADADQVINSMLSRTNEFTISGSLWARDDHGRVYNRKNTSNTTILSWSVYDFGSNRDFYYVEEQHHIRMGGENSDKGKTLYWGPYRKEDWMWTPEKKLYLFGSIWVPKTFSIEGYEDRGSAWGFYYGSWLDESSHTMNLTGDAGEIQVMKSLPSTDNNQSTETIAIGSTDGTSSTKGWSFGGSLTGNAGVSGPNGTGGGSLGFNLSYTSTTTTSHSTSFTMSTSSVSKDLAIKRNTDGTKVKWTYEPGHTPQFIYEKFWHEMAAPILTNDIDIENKVCWSVKKPSGSYKLYWHRINWTRALYVENDRNTRITFSKSCGYDETYTLTPPRRFKKEWRCDLRVEGKNLKDDADDKFRQELQKDINTYMFDNRFELAEAEDDGVEVIKYNVGVATKMLKSDDELRDMIEYKAKSLGIEKYTIKWFTLDKAVKAKHKKAFTFEREIGKK